MSENKHTDFAMWLECPRLHHSVSAYEITVTWRPSSSSLHSQRTSSGLLNCPSSSKSLHRDVGSFIHVLLLQMSLMPSVDSCVPLRGGWNNEHPGCCSAGQRGVCRVEGGKEEGLWSALTLQWAESPGPEFSVSMTIVLQSHINTVTPPQPAQTACSRATHSQPPPLLSAHICCLSPRLPHKSTSSSFRLLARGKSHKQADLPKKDQPIRSRQLEDTLLFFLLRTRSGTETEADLNHQIRVKVETTLSSHLHPCSSFAEMDSLDPAF